MPQPTSYFESKVMTASPAQLHLMLIEGAVRFCTRAQQELEKHNEGHANEAMTRAIDIVGELLAGVRGGESEINKKLSDLYLFLFHTLTSAYVNTDAVKLADVLRILEFERETWQLACERAHSDEPATTGKPGARASVIAPHVAAPLPAEGFSLEA
jgi:flagellar secretion chaperone FliS